MKHIAIIGAGVLGLSCAYYLRKAGCEVSLLERGDLSDSCSQGNAGMIVPSHVVPLASPGNLRQGLSWGWRPGSPLSLHPSMDPEFWRWLGLFVRHARDNHVERCVPVLRDLSLYSLQLVEAWQQELPQPFGYRSSGLLMLYRSRAAEKEERSTARLARAAGLQVELLGPGELRGLEPHAAIRARGAFYFPGDALVDPARLHQSLLAWLRAAEVRIHTGFQVSKIHSGSQGFVLDSTSSATLQADVLVLAAGSYSGRLARMMGASLPLQPGKGYSFFHPSLEGLPSIPCLLQDGRVSVSPYPSGVRFGGTLQIGTWDRKLRQAKLSGMLSAIRSFFPEAELAEPPQEQVWQGLRPCSPDGLPYLGRLSATAEAYVAAGHGMMGLSLAAASGRLLADLICGQRPLLDLGPLNPGRFAAR